MPEEINKEAVSTMRITILGMMFALLTALGVAAGSLLGGDEVENTTIINASEKYALEANPDWLQYQGGDAGNPTVAAILQVVQQAALDAMSSADEKTREALLLSMNECLACMGHDTSDGYDLDDYNLLKEAHDKIKGSSPPKTAQDWLDLWFWKLKHGHN